jgi:hypothetical protein
VTAGGTLACGINRPIIRAGERNAGPLFFAIERWPTARTNLLRGPTIN